MKLLINLILIISIVRAQRVTTQVLQPDLTYGVKNVNGVLSFADDAHVERVGLALVERNKAIEESIRAKVAANGCKLPAESLEGLQVDETAAEALRIAPVEEDPNDDCIQKVFAGVANAYEEFERALGFTSLRAVNKRNSDAYLQSAASDTNPEGEPGLDVVALEEDQALLSPQRQIIVAGKCIQLNGDGDGPCPLTISPTIAVQLSKANRRLPNWWCRTNVHNWGYRYCRWWKTRRTRWQVGHYWWPWTSCRYRAYARTSCQRRWFWPWIWWTGFYWNYAKVFGHTSAPQFVGCSVDVNLCNIQHPFNTAGASSSGWGWWRTHTVPVPSRTASGWVKGVHYSSCCPWYKYETALYF